MTHCQLKNHGTLVYTKRILQNATTIWIGKTENKAKQVWGRAQNNIQQ
jgi:hypothetical protein